MSTKPVRLTLVFPPALEAAITGALASDPRMPGFTVLHAEGHGHDFTNASPTEIVRGRIEQRVLWIVTDADEPPRLLAALRKKIPSPDIVWWIDELSDFGRLV